MSAFWQRLYRLLGFQRGHNFVLWCLLALGLLGFTLSRAPYLNYYGIFCKRNSLAPSLHAAPGECYFFLNGGQEQIGMMMHVYGILPCCLLLFFQFVPVIRHKALLFHRINGYIVVLLMTVAVVGGLMATGNSFGGDLAFQVANVLLGASVVTCLVLAMISVKRQRIDQHRAWMLRGWVLVRHRPVSNMGQAGTSMDPVRSTMGSHHGFQQLFLTDKTSQASSIITMRIIQNAASRAVSGQEYTAMRPCAQINSDGILPRSVIERAWPDCAAYFTGTHPDQRVLVRADYYGLPIEINVALSIASGASAFVALFLHAMGVEVYVSTRKTAIALHAQSSAGQLTAI
jgi:uncharacterized membrane protein